jgi:hypothetical protein
MAKVVRIIVIVSLDEVRFFYRTMPFFYCARMEILIWSSQWARTVPYKRLHTVNHQELEATELRAAGLAE